MWEQQTTAVRCRSPGRPAWVGISWGFVGVQCSAQWLALHRAQPKSEFRPVIVGARLANSWLAGTMGVNLPS